MKKIAEGAEARLYLEDSELVKDRVEKKYRHPLIDRHLRTKRTRLESRLLTSARRAGVLTPQVLDTEEFKIRMEYVKGDKVKDTLDKITAKKRGEICRKIGKEIAKLHAGSIIHGDLTTSNIIYSHGKVYFIDFGLGEKSDSFEKMATDLHLLKEVFRSTHYRHFESFGEVIKGYKWKDAAKVLAQLKEVEKRGRYK